jgi:hypothetical protein
VDVACFWIHEIQILHPLGEILLLRELALSQDSVLLSSTQTADLGVKYHLKTERLKGPSIAPPR